MSELMFRMLSSFEHTQPGLVISLSLEIYRSARLLESPPLLLIRRAIPDSSCGKEGCTPPIPLLLN